MISRSAADERKSIQFPREKSLKLMVLCRSSEPQDERAPSAGAKSLCIPFDQSRWASIEQGKTKCPACNKDAKHWTLFGRSY